MSIEKPVLCPSCRVRGMRMEMVYFKPTNNYECFTCGRTKERD